jgi:hypothetical protein
MGLLDLFRKPAPVDTIRALDECVDSHAAFLVQKCIYEYCRARSGVLAAKLFREPSFVAAMNRSRWQNYPICLGHVAVMVEGALRPHVGDSILGLTDGIVAAVERVTAGHEAAAGMEAGFWIAARRRIEERLRHASLAAPRAVKEIPKEDYQAFFDQLPIHESLRGHDFLLVRNNLRVNLCRAYETFIARADLPVLARAIAAEPAPAVARRAGVGLD